MDITKVSLFEVSQEVADAFIEAVDPETGEIDTSKLTDITKMWDKKGSNVIAFRNNMKADLQKLKDFVALKQKQIKSIENAIAGMDAYTLACMKNAGMSEIKAIDGSFRAKLYIDRDESVDVYDFDLLSDEFIRVVPEKREADKTAIKKALKAGEEIQGARLIRKDRLEIK